MRLAHADSRGHRLVAAAAAAPADGVDAAAPPSRAEQECALRSPPSAWDVARMRRSAADMFRKRWSLSSNGGRRGCCLWRVYYAAALPPASCALSRLDRDKYDRTP